ncbi:EcoAI/FtnUII family type I restriction enzme subunit R [Pseudomaricurvus sp. HS19]|uniref:EcoAI/FtnUII family type I restriction enzme subunit R n=1 Tax=Pseudomaricurvus sp. HS19 TaxID=2692626 RepID=UPI0013721A19|nr:DEAD/DEAH box helicase family protein [Pseudomaricurvus sp. HS19]MYM63316.1 DEAD/DEAH box helicase family protein [Pseudomaricurvus sp. HS19]
MSLEEADTCRVYVTPKIKEAGWDKLPHAITEQKTFTDGRITVHGKMVKRGKRKRPDYLLKYTRDFTIAVVEAKPEKSSVGQGLQQAKDYAISLGLKFAYSTNGHEILEFDFTTGEESLVSRFPTPDELFKRLCEDASIDKSGADTLLTPYHHVSGYTPRYYQQIAINRAVQSVLQGKKRALITMATGTGKTVVAFQICWKLWSARWNISGEYRKPRVLFLADRNVLVDDPKDKTFAPFGDARYKIEGGKITKSREIYFSTYQSIARDERRPGLYKQFSSDFFDLIIIDECHRGSARDDSNWREILEYFEPAYQIGMTATPLREDSRNTYRYFGKAIYTYSLKKGIEDGFLAPYRVHRVVSEVDAVGWRPSRGDVDRYGREIPDGEYQTKDFERVIALRMRTEAFAKHLSDFMARTDRFAKTIVFCVDQEHADEMRRALSNLNADLVRKYPDYVARVTSEEGAIGKGHLSRFQELETTAPVILTTSQLLTTGVDAPTCKNVVLARVVNSMSEFKQIVGRGTRLREDYGKLWFNIIDYTGSATQNFADPGFDGYPEIEDEVVIDAAGDEIHEETIISETDDPAVAEERGDYDVGQDSGVNAGDGNDEPRKYYVDGGSIKITSHLVYELDEEGKQLRVIQYTDYTAEKVKTLFSSLDELKDRWADPVKREEVILELQERGIQFDDLANESGKPEADPLDLLCHIAFNAPLRTRKQRADYLQKNKPDFFDQYGPEARKILTTLLDKYTDHGPKQFSIPDSLQVPPISEYGNVIEIANLFGGALQMKTAVDQLQTLLYTEQ